MLPLGAAELKTRDGKTWTYDSIDVDPSRPKSTYVLKSAGTVVSLKLSEVDPAELPTGLRAQVDTFVAAQADAGLILYDNEWIDRDGHLLKTDPRFAYPRKLVPAGRNRFELVNRGPARITVGIRPVAAPNEKQRGYEIAVDPGKSRTIQLGDGAYGMLLVTASPDDSELAVEEAEPVVLEHTRYQLTIGAKENTLKTRAVGTIAIPADMRRAR